jgi:hypothetical protein
MQTTLNDIQLELLALFQGNQSSEDLRELKELLRLYLANKVVREADKAFSEKGYSQAIFEEWKNLHFRKSA